MQLQASLEGLSKPHVELATAGPALWLLSLPAIVAVSLSGLAAAAAAECTQPNAPIETDRPDVTNSSIVVPIGSLQNENGIDISRDRSANLLNGPNSRWRLGVAPCLEVLIDVPTYVTTLRGAGPSGFGDVVPAVKWQLSPLPGKFDVSVTAGAALPIGATAIAGSGVQPYLQIPWSIALGGGWALTGMESIFFTPASDAKFTYQSTLVIEKEIAERSFLFVEYVGDFPSVGRNSQLINSGGGYRIDDHHQIDFHIGVGLDRNAPNYFSAWVIRSASMAFCVRAILRFPRKLVRACGNRRYFFVGAGAASAVWARFGLCDIGPHQFDGVSSPQTFGRCGRS